MYKTTVKVDGMMCNMCESHVNDTIRQMIPQAKKVSSSHTKGETIFQSKEIVDEDTIRSAIDKSGYSYISSSTEEYKKKGLFGR